MDNVEQSISSAMREMAQETERKNIRLGMALAVVINSYYWGDLLAYLKGDDEHNGSMYFCNLKPLYDEYGYEKVNKALLEIDKEKRLEMDKEKSANE